MYNTLSEHGLARPSATRAAPARRAPSAETTETGPPRTASRAWRGQGNVLSVSSARPGKERAEMIPGSETQEVEQYIETDGNAGRKLAAPMGKKCATENATVPRALLRAGTYAREHVETVAGTARAGGDWPGVRPSVPKFGPRKCSSRALIRLQSCPKAMQHGVSGVGDLILLTRLYISRLHPQEKLNFGFA